MTAKRIRDLSGTFKITCPAKVNLGLKVVGRREDGYHLLKMVMEPVSLFDVLGLRVSSAPSPVVTLQCPDIPGLKTGDNLVIKAARKMLAMAAAKGIDTAADFSFFLDKQIPVGAGLGGGSSDAAATLLLLNALLSLELSLSELQALAIDLGADVPFFLQPELCLVEGIGERLSPLSPPHRRWYVLLKPPFAINTSWAYKKLNYELTNNKYNINMRQFFQPVCEREKYSLFNDFEEVIFSEFQQLDEIKQWFMGRREVRGALMSGSGSAVYAVFSAYEPTVQAYKEACARWGGSGWLVFLVHNLL